MRVELSETAPQANGRTRVTKPAATLASVEFQLMLPGSRIQAVEIRQHMLTNNSSDRFVPGSHVEEQHQLPDAQLHVRAHPGGWAAAWAPSA